MSPEPLDPSPDSPSPEPHSSKRGVGGGGVRGAVRVLLAAFSVLTIAAAALQVPVVSRFVFVSLVNAVPGLEASAERVSGGWFGGLEVTGLEVSQHGRPLVSARQLRVRYSLVSWFARRIVIDEVGVQGLVFRQPPLDSASTRSPAPWDWLTGAAWPYRPLQVDQLELRDARAEGGTDSTAWRLDDLQLRVQHLQLGGGPTTLVLDTLGVRSSAPGGRGHPVSVEFAASLTPMQLDVRTLRVRGGESLLEGQGTLMLAGSGERPVRDARFTLRAAPLMVQDLAVLWGAPSARGRVEATIELAGAEPRQWNGSAVLRSPGLAWPGFSLGATQLDAQIAQGRTQWQGASVVEGVAVATTGWARAFDDLPSGAAELRAPRLPRAWPALPWESVAGPHAGELRATLAGGRVELDARMLGAHDGLAARGALDLRRAPSYVMHALTLTRVARSGAPLADGVLRVDSVAVGSGRTSRLTISGGRVQALDLAHWLAPGATTGLVNARFEGSAELGKAHSGELQVALEPSTIAGLSAGPGRLRAELRPSGVRVTGDLSALSGKLAIELSADTRGAEPEFTLHELRFTALDLGAWLSAGSHTRLTGQADGAFTGDRPKSLRGDLTLSILPSEINGIALSGAAARLQASRGALRATLQASATGGTLESEWSADLTAERPRFTGSGRVPFPLLAHLLLAHPPATSGAARFELQGEGAELATLQGAARLTANGTVAEVAIDSLRAALRVGGGLVVADTLELGSAAGWLTGSGRIAALDPASPATSDLRLQGRLTHGVPLARALALDTLMAREARFTARVSGPARALALDAEARWAALQVNGVHSRDGFVNARAQFNEKLALVTGQVQATLAGASAGGLEASHFEGRVRQDDAGLRFEATSGLMGTQRARLEGRATRGGVELSHLEVGSDAHRWALSGPARVKRVGERYEVESFEMRSDSGSARVQGVLDRRQDSDLSLELRHLPLAAWTPLIGRPELAGRIDANVRLSGPAAQPRLTGTSTIAIRAPWGPVGLLRTQLGWAGPRMDVEAAFVPSGASPLSVVAVLPYALSLADSTTLVRETTERYDVRLTARNVAIASLAPLLDPQSFLPRAGTLDADAHFEGTPGAMTGSGHIDVRDADVAIPELGARYRDVQIRSLVERDGLRIVSARAMTGKGSVQAKGVVRLPRLERPVFDLALTADRFRAAESRDLSVLVSGGLRIAGEATAPEITGSITLQNSSVYLTPSSSDTSEVELTPADLRMLEDTFGLVRAGAGDPARQFYEAARFGVDVKLAGDVWVRQRTVPRLEVELRGAFRFDKAARAWPRLTGRIAPAPDRGYVEQFARRFTFTGGEILLNGELADHQLDLKTEFKVPSPISSSAPRVVVHLDVQGTPLATRLILSSEPAMEQSEIVSYIISGQTTRERSGSRSTSRTNMATALPLQLGLSQITAPLEEFARQKVGLDVVEVRQDGLQGATLVAGRFLDPRLYVGFRQPVAGRDPNARGSAAAVRTRFELEYSAFEWLVLNLQGESSRVRSFLRVSHAYR